MNRWSQEHLTVSVTEAKGQQHFEYGQVVIGEGIETDRLLRLPFFRLS